MLKKLWAWFAPKRRDYTAETLERCTKACAECGVALHAYHVRAQKVADVLNRNGAGKVSDADAMSELHELLG